MVPTGKPPRLRRQRKQEGKERYERAFREEKSKDERDKAAVPAAATADPKQVKVAEGTKLASEDKIHRRVFPSPPFQSSLGKPPERGRSQIPARKDMVSEHSTKQDDTPAKARVVPPPAKAATSAVWKGVGGKDKGKRPEKGKKGKGKGKGTTFKGKGKGKVKKKGS